MKNLFCKSLCRHRWKSWWLIGCSGR